MLESHQWKSGWNVSEKIFIFKFHKYLNILLVLQEGRLMLGGYFLMAARDPNTFKSKQLPKLKLETEEQFELERNALGIFHYVYYFLKYIDIMKILS